MAALVRARHDVFGVVEVPATYLELDEWTEVDASTPTAREERRLKQLRDDGLAPLYDPADHRLEPVDDDEGVLAYLEAAAPDERQRVIEAERARGAQARKTVLEWQPAEG